MGKIGRLVLRIADSDYTWVGFNWMRPSRETRLSWTYLAGSSILLGLPGLAVGAGGLYLALGRIDPQVWLWMVGLVFTVELILHAVLGFFWNARASELARAAKI